MTSDLLRIVLLGKTGSGKSSTGNTILGEDRFPVKRLLGATGEREVQTHLRQSHHGTIQVMDTPGLCDCEESARDVSYKLVEGLAPGPHVVLFVLRCDHRFTMEEYKAYSMIKALFDSDITQHMIIVFTGGDVFEDRAVKIDEVLAQAPEQLRTMLTECGDRYVVVNNRADSESRERQADKVLEKIEDLRRERQDRPFITPYVAEVDAARKKKWVDNRLGVFYFLEMENWRPNGHQPPAATFRSRVFDLGTFVADTLITLVSRGTENLG